MITVAFIRVLFVLLAAVIGYQLGPVFLGFEDPASGLYGAGLGALFAGLIIWLELGMAKVSLRGLSAAVFGLLLALIVAKFVCDAVDLASLDPTWAASIKLIVTVILCYLGMVLAMRGRDEFNVIIPYVKLQRQKQTETLIVVDTSVIIDGRIADVARTKFLQGHFVVPKFVLRELQKIADSSDSMRRARGRRGLEILNRLRKDPRISLRIHEEDFPELGEVDAKLVKLAKLLDARILTHDYNLNKIAELQDVEVLNIHELSNALKPIVLPGERLEVSLTKEGKERDQAVAYLNDGTMVVVERGRKLIGTTLNVVVTSVLQTAAGRMIFARLEGDR